MDDLVAVARAARVIVNDRTAHDDDCDGHVIDTDYSDAIQATRSVSIGIDSTKCSCWLAPLAAALRALDQEG